MNFNHFFAQSAFIQIHTYLAIFAILIGARQLIGRKGTTLHKALGWIWVIMMLIVSLSSFWIKELMPNSKVWGFSPIHLLSIFALIQLILGVYNARVGDIESHKRRMAYTYAGGLLIAGFFTFYPDRLMYRVVFG